MDNVVKEMEEAKDRAKHVAYLTEVRTENILYLKKLYDKDERLNWLNVVSVPPQDILRQMDDKDRVSKRYFHN